MNKCSMNVKWISTILAICLLMMRHIQAVEQSDVATNLTIRSDVAAPKWDHGYPVGNGRLGLLSLGAYPTERLYLNENSIWARQEVVYPEDAAEAIRQIRVLAQAGKYQEADRL